MIINTRKKNNTIVSFIGLLVSLCVIQSMIAKHETMYTLNECPENHSIHNCSNIAIAVLCKHTFSL